jgi:hypothetical protein
MSKQNRNSGRGKTNSVNITLAVLLALIIFVNTATFANALGVAPGRTPIDFEPGLDKTFSFTIKNNENKQFNAYIYVEGDLSEYITIEKRIVEFEKADDSHAFTYRISLPQRLDPPGEHWGKIIVMELPSGLERLEGKTQIVGTIAVMHQVKVKVPYPGKYMQLDMAVQEAAPNESVRFFVKMYNLGKEDIGKAEATIEILGPTDEVIAKIETGQTAVESMQKGELTADWKASVNPGLYKAVAKVRYDGEAGSVEKKFYVGNIVVDLLGVSVKDFKLGGIAKFDIITESKWNQPIAGVYADMKVNDNQGNKVADFKSASVDIDPFERAHMYAYWDTEGVLEGDYVTTLTLNYAGRKTEKEIRTYVGLEAIRTEIVGVSVGAVTAEEVSPEQYPIMLIVAILVAINMGWFLYFRKRRK